MKKTEMADLALFHSFCLEYRCNICSYLMTTGNKFETKENHTELALSSPCYWSNADCYMFLHFLFCEKNELLFEPLQSNFFLLLEIKVFITHKVSQVGQNELFWAEIPLCVKTWRGKGLWHIWRQDIKCKWSKWCWCWWVGVVCWVLGPGCWVLGTGWDEQSDSRII